MGSAGQHTSEMSPEARTYTTTNRRLVVVVVRRVVSPPPQPPRAAKFGHSYRFTDNAVLTPGGRRMAEHRAASSYGA